MKTYNGFIKLHKRLQNWEWYNDPLTLSVWIHCLMRANYETTDYKGIHIEPGQFVFGRREFSEEIGCSERQIRTCLDRLVKSQNLTIKTTNKGSVATVEKWGFYQTKPKRATSISTNERPANDQQATTKQEVIEYKNYRSVVVSNSKREFWQRLAPEDIDAIYEEYPNTGGYLIDEVANMVVRKKIKVHDPRKYILGYAINKNWNDNETKEETNEQV